MDFDTVIIGAGGAGMMCAIHAGRRGRRVALLDHSRKIGRKILISGGGRCNFTNINAGPESFVSENPHFAKSALSRYTAVDFIELVKEHKIAFHEKKLGQLFCDHSAQQIVDLLVQECKKAGAKFQLECQIKAVRKDDRFLIDTNNGTYRADSLVIATGGLSIPKIGATGFGYKIAEQFGLNMVKTRPALDGFVFTSKQQEDFINLAGVSADSLVSCNNASFRENILFTHVGLSGPASLQASLYWTEGSPVSINLFPDFNLEEWLLAQKAQSSNVQVKNLLGQHLPKSLATVLTELYLDSRPVRKIPEPELKQFAQRLYGWDIVPAKTVGYRKAEVTRGGVDTKELSSKTMESKKIPGLYFIGEVVDVTGQLGGYNFQWAWASGFAAGQYV